LIHSTILVAPPVIVPVFKRYTTAKGGASVVLSVITQNLLMAHFTTAFFRMFIWTRLLSQFLLLHDLPPQDLLFDESSESLQDSLLGSFLNHCQVYLDIFITAIFYYCKICLCNLNYLNRYQSRYQMHCQIRYHIYNLIYHIYRIFRIIIRVVTTFTF